MFHQYKSCRGIHFIATGFPESIHDSKVLILYQRVNNSVVLLEPKVNVNVHQVGPMLIEDRKILLSKWLPRPYIFNPTLSAQEKNLTKNLSSARITVWRVFRITKVRWKDLLTTLVVNRENVSNTIITCFVLPNRIWKTIIMNQERAKHRNRYNNSKILLYVERIRTISNNNINEM